MRVCIVGSLPRPLGGVATYCYNLSSELSKLGTEVTFFDRNPNKDKIIPKGLNDYEMLNGSLSVFLKIFSNLTLSSLRSFIFLWIKLFAECFKFRKNLSIPGILNVYIIALSLFFNCSEKNIDLIHTQHAYSRSLSSLIVGNVLNIPVVVTIFASEFTSLNLKKLRPLAIHICNSANHVISISEHTKKAAKKAGVNSEIEVIYLGVDTSFHSHYDISECRNKFNLVDEKVILYVGWLIERKGPLLLLEAVARLKDGNFKVFFIGPDHGLKEKMESYIRKLNLNSVYVIGSVDDLTLRRFYSLSDIFVFPTMTEDEGFGLVAVEAMASETVVIGSRIGAIPEVVRENESGFLFDVGDSNDLANQISILLKNDEFLYKMKKRAAEYVRQNFSWNFTAKATLNVYEKVVCAYG